jgi:hypothetical protein
LLILEGTFAISEVFVVLLGRVVTTLDVFFEKHSCSVHFCLMNLVMISQTAQCWSTDGVFSSLRSEKDFLASENEGLTMFVCYHRAVRKL